MGRAGATIRGLQERHGVTLTLPARDTASDEVLVAGPSQAAVTAAIAALNELLGYQVQSLL